MDRFAIFLTRVRHRVSTSWSSSAVCADARGERERLTYTRLSVAVQHKLHVTRTLGAVVRLLADVLATAVAVVTSHYQRVRS